MEQQAMIENLRWWSQVYLWLAIGIPILGAIAGGLLNIKRQHIEGKVRELSTQLTEQALREVEAQQRPRTLTVDQQRMLIQQLRAGPKGRFEILLASYDSEADHFGRQFDLVLKDAGWTRKKSGFGSTYLDEDYQTQFLVGLMIDVGRAELAPHGEFLRQTLTRLASTSRSESIRMFRTRSCDWSSATNRGRKIPRGVNRSSSHDPVGVGVVAGVHE
jgi:hypothetical protein